VTLEAGPGAVFEWIPQETILFEGARLERRLNADIAEDATLLMAEALVFGRAARGETWRRGALQDSWRIRRGGKLLWADGLSLGEDIPADFAEPFGLANVEALGSLVLAGPLAFVSGLIGADLARPKVALAESVEAQTRGQPLHSPGLLDRYARRRRSEPRLLLLQTVRALVLGDCRGVLGAVLLLVAGEVRLVLSAVGALVFSQAVRVRAVVVLRVLLNLLHVLFAVLPFVLFAAQGVSGAVLLLTCQNILLVGMVVLSGVDALLLLLELRLHVYQLDGFGLLGHKRLHHCRSGLHAFYRRRCYNF
jgi:hypothetical protein